MSAIILLDVIGNLNAKVWQRLWPRLFKT
ncbi:hypothetical protein CGCA056_v008266 [Colletotrichum aenigma]|nr:hypothetical protein CGCA056_v008266 [Colletotrichum aenigma]